MAYTDIVLASTPIHYWPLNETSGTTADDAVGALNGTAVGLTMGNTDGPTGGKLTEPGGIGGKAVAFTGTQHILLNANKILGGLPEWTVSAWVNANLTDTLEHVFYGEMSTAAGADMIRASIKGPSTSPTMMHTYGSDASLVSKTSGSVFVHTVWILVHFVRRTGGIVEMWWNGGQRSRQTGAASGDTWTNATPATWIGAPPRTGNGSGFVGKVAHLFVHDRALTAPEISTLYRGATPLQRPLLDKTLWTPSSPWNQRLDDEDNVPDVAANSATQVANLVAQVATYGAGLNVGLPVYCVDDSEPTQAVRLEGGTNNPSTDKPALFDAFQDVPIPTPYDVGLATDYESVIYNTDTDSLWEPWIMGATLVRPEFVVATAIAGGTIPVNATPYAYVVYPADGAHAIGSGRSAAATVTLGNQSVTVTWGTSEGATAYRIYRRLNTPGSSGGNFMVEVSAATHSWTDNGSITPGASSTAAAAAATADYGCSYAGYIADTDASPGYYENPRANWGASATSLPLSAGLITIEDLYAVLAGGTIDHAIAMGVFETPNTHVFPAQRHDFWNGSHNVEEGTRFRLDPTYDVNTLTNPLAREIARAYQVYGVIVRDHTGAITGGFVEGSQKLGRDPFPETFSGLQSYEIFAGFPWSRLEAVDPAWTQAQVTPAPDVHVPIATLTDSFSGGSIDTSKWTTVNAGVSQSDGQLHIAAHGSPYGRLDSVVPLLQLNGSSVFVPVAQRPYGAGGAGSDQAGFQIASNVNLSLCVMNFWTEGDGVLKLEYFKPTGVKTTVATTPWDAVAHRYQRLRESSGVIYAEVSADGSTWAELGHFTWTDSGWLTSALDDVVLKIFAGNFGGVTGRPDFVLDSVNVVEGGPAGPAPPDGTLGFTISMAPWPNGTTVSVYRASAWPDPTRAPSGQAVNVAVVTNGSVTFANLGAKIRYVAYALGHGVTFLVKSPIDPDLRAVTGRDLLETLEEQLTALQAEVDALV